MSMSVPEVAQAVQQGRVQLVDLAAPPRFVQAHPAGAVNVPFGPAFALTASTALVADRPVVVFAEHQAVADRAADDLRKTGFEIAHVFAGGVAAWQAQGGQVDGVKQMSVEDLARSLAAGADVTVLDVREPYEWRSGIVPGAVLMSLSTLPGRYGELDAGKTIAVLCAHGNRSAQAAAWLQDQGFQSVHNVPGGMALWLNGGHPTAPPPQP